MSTLESALLRCTSPAGPSFAATPFPAVVNGQPVRIATDGKLLLMVDDPGGDAGAECDPRVLGLINRYSNPPTLHASRADLLRLRLVERRVVGLLHNDYLDSRAATELSAAIDGVVDLLRMPPPDPMLVEHQEMIARRLFGLGGMG